MNFAREVIKVSGNRGIRGCKVGITIRGLCKHYGGVTVLDNVSLDIPSGQFVTLLGPSGSGKTTLLMAIAGFTRPNAGSVKFDDQEIIRTAPHKRNLGVVFQNYALFPHMTVAQNIAYPLRLRKVSRSDIQARVTRVLDLVKLSGLQDRATDQLSGGQRQRVALARAIVFEPRILLMDEPLSALDKALREEMQIEIRHLHETLGITTIAVTHDQQEALVMSDQIAVINNGRIAQMGTPRQIYDQPANRFVAGFIGESQILDVQVRDELVYFDDQQPLRFQIAGAPASGRAYLVLRPEKLRILETDVEDYNVFRGIVSEVIYRGQSVQICVQLKSGAELVIRRTTDHAELKSLPAVGQDVRIGVHIADTLVVPHD